VSMIRSLAVKFIMLAVTIALVYWFGREASESSPKHAASGDDSRNVPLVEPAAVESDAKRSDRFAARTGTAESGAFSEASSGSASGKLLDINRAGAEELESLPGVGAVLAQRVIEYRTTVGRFQAIEDLRAVKGIGPKVFERLKPLVTVATVKLKGKAEKRPL
jgi:competence protein ComEA